MAKKKSVVKKSRATVQNRKKQVRKGQTVTSKSKNLTKTAARKKNPAVKSALSRLWALVFTRESAYTGSALVGVFATSYLAKKRALPILASRLQALLVDKPKDASAIWTAMNQKRSVDEKQVKSAFDTMTEYLTANSVKTLVVQPLCVKQ